MGADRRRPRLGHWGFFDVGSNSVLCLVVEVLGATAQIRYDASIVSGLGKGLSDAGLHPDSRARTFTAIETHLHRVAELGLAPRYVAVATSAMRDAADGPAFVDRIRRALGLKVQIISGEREAELTWLAVRQSFPELARTAVVDIGGGSTEVMVAEGDALKHRQSLNIGSVRLTGRCVEGDPPTAQSLAHLRQEIDGALGALPPLPEGCVGVASGSTATTVLAFRDGVEPYDPSRIHGVSLRREDVARAVDTLSRATVAERAAMPGIDPARAEVIVAGAAILGGAMDRLGLPEVRISDRGLRFGVMADALPGVLID